LLGRPALPCLRSAGTDTWSCTTSQTPSIRRKQAVQRTHISVVWPLASVPRTWLRLWTKARSPSAVTSGLGSSYENPPGYAAKALSQA
jgi:hypothetical protein